MMTMVIVRADNEGVEDKNGHGDYHGGGGDACYGNGDGGGDDEGSGNGDGAGDDEGKGGGDTACCGDDSDAGNADGGDDCNRSGEHLEMVTATMELAIVVAVMATVAVPPKAVSSITVVISPKQRGGSMSCTAKVMGCGSIMVYSRLS